MRRVIVSMNVSIDGFIASDGGALDWQFDYWAGDMARLLGEQLSQAGSILLGSNTYNAMAAYWPFVSSGLGLSRDDLAYATLMNDYPKLVCSNTLKTTQWSNSVILNGDICNQIDDLKRLPGKDIIIYGSHTLVKHLTRYKLIDEYRLWFYPVALGAGVPLFDQQLSLKHLSTTQFTSGVVLLSYQCLY